MEFHTKDGIAFGIPYDWDAVTLGEFLHIVEHGRLPLPVPIEMLETAYLGKIALIQNILLNTIPDWKNLPFEPIDITQYSYGQKVDALHYYGENVSDLHRALPILLSIYAQRNGYNHDNAQRRVDEVCRRSVLKYYPRGLSIIRQLEAVENELSNSLKKVPYDPPEIESCFKDLQQWGAYAVVDSLAHGDKTKHDFFFNLPVAEVHTMIRYDNARAYCQYQAQQVVKAKANRK
jgi:hypothetical protein